MTSTIEVSLPEPRHHRRVTPLCPEPDAPLLMGNLLVASAPCPSEEREKEINDKIENESDSDTEFSFQ